MYVENNKPAKKLANIALHELMHNKLQLDNNGLHNIAGVGIGQTGTNDCSVLTPTDITRMAAGMGNAVRQYAALLPGDVAAKFVNPAEPPPTSVLVCSTGTKPSQGYLSPADRAAATSAVDWSRVVRRPAAK